MEVFPSNGAECAMSCMSMCGMLLCFVFRADRQDTKMLFTSAASSRNTNKLRYDAKTALAHARQSRHGRNLAVHRMET